MSRHASPNKKRIDDAFPVRVKIKVPPTGLGNLVHDTQIWLRDNCGVDGAASLSTSGVYCDAKAFYFRNVEDAQRFLEAFPDLELADGVERISVYASP